MLKQDFSSDVVRELYVTVPPLLDKFQDMPGAYNYDQFARHG